MIAASLLGQGFELVPVKTTSHLIRTLDRRAADAVVLGPSVISPGHGFEVARQIREFAGAIPLILVVPNSSEELAIAACVGKPRSGSVVIWALGEKGGRK